MASTKASQCGLTQIKRAIAQKGWTMSDDRWLVEASKMLEPSGNWNESGPYAYGCSRQTWERFLQGTAIRERSFIAFCQIVGVDPDDVAESASSLREDWGEAPDVPIFHGREQELATLQHWILKEKCRLITIVGLAGIGKTRLVRGGIGKTDLSLQLARQVRGEFEYLIWRRLLNAPPPEAILTELIEFVSDNQEKNWAKTADGLVTQLLQYLSKHRCLLILDNIESILHSGERAGTYRAGYEGYRELFRRIGETEHQSCLLLTSRVKPQDIEEMEGIRLVRSLMLGGVDRSAGQAIFHDIGCAYNTNFHGSEEDWETLIDFYNGNPLALEVAARHILRRFNGNIPQFLQHNLRVFGKIRDLLDWHFERLSEAEKTVMYWLAINREPVSIAELKEDILLPRSKKHLPETLDTLERQIPLEKSDDRLTLQPVLMEYISDRFIEQICEEINTNKLQLLNSHALIKASAKDYVRDSQLRIILNPVIEQLISMLGLDKPNCLDYQLSQILSSLKQSSQNLPGYAAGNLLNLMHYGDIDVSGYDFSHLAIWQADLQGIELHNVNFNACEFANASFTQDFGAVHSLAFSPDGEVLAIGDSHGDIRLFHLQDEQPYLCLKGHQKNQWVTSVAFSPDGNLLVSSGMDKTVKLWNTHTGECLKTLVGSQQWLCTVAFSQDGQTVASGGDDNTIRLWNINTGNCQILEGHDAWIFSIAFHPHEDLLASSGFDNTIRLWNIETGECCRIISGHENIVCSVAFHPDGKTLASGSTDNTIKLWNVDTGECLNTLKGHTKKVNSTAFNADGQIIASGSFDRTVKLWEAPTGKLLKTLKGHLTGVENVAFDPHKNILASGDNNQMLKLWDINTGECLKTWQGYINSLWKIAISPDGQLLASGSVDKTVILWDINTGKQIATLKGHHNWVMSVAFSPDGQILASGSDDETIKLWDVSTRQCQNTLRGHSKGGVWPILFSPNGQLLVSVGRDRTIRFWDVGTRESLRCIPAHSGWIWSIAFSPDGQFLASSSEDQMIKLWNVKTGECCLSIRDTSSKVKAVAFHPDGQRLVSGGEDRQIKLWDLTTGELIQTFPGHTDLVIDLLFSPEGNFCVSASEDATIRIWEVDTRQCIRVLKGHDSMVRAIALTPDRKTLASGSMDGTIRLWDFATGKTLKVLRPKRPYEGMNIADVKGLTPAQKDTFIALGANQF